METVQEKKKALLAAIMAMERTSPTRKVTHPSDIFSVFAKYTKRKQECFFVSTLNGNNELLHTRVVTKGLLNRTLVHPREIFRSAIKDNAQAIIVGHNHPSGSLVPSEEDKAITSRLVRAGEILGIEVLDHLIVSKEGFYSFREEGKI